MEIYPTASESEKIPNAKAGLFLSLLKMGWLSRAVVTHPFNLSTQEAEAGRSLWVWGQSSLQSEFQDSQDSTEKLFLKKQKNKAINQPIKQKDS